jgi:hypothetical protein
MEFLVAQKLKEEWGDKPCVHVHLEKMYYAGAFLIVYGCRQCGAEFTIAQKLEMDLAKKAALPGELK